MELHNLTANKGWAGLAVGVLAYEVLCPEGEMLSEGVDRYLERNKTATAAVIGVTALHLMNLLPEAVDPYHWTLKALRGLNRGTGV